MSAIPFLYCDFINQIYWLEGAYVSFSDIFSSGTVGVGGLQVDNGAGVAFFTAAAETAIRAPIFADGISGIETWTITDPDSLPLGAPFVTDNLTGAGLTYVVASSPPPAGASNFEGCGNPGPSADVQGTAVFGFDPTGSGTKYFTINGQANITLSPAGAFGIVAPNLQLSPSGVIAFFALYPFNEGPPPTDFPGISGGTIPPPGPPSPSATWDGTGNLTWGSVAVPTPTYPAPINVVFPPNGGITPSSALAHLFNIKHYMLLLSVQDQFGNNPRNVMLTWNEKDWVVTSQSVNLTRIAQQKVESKFTAWGTDGTNLFPLFQQASGNLTKTLTTKTYGIDTMLVTKQLRGLWTALQDNTAAQAGVTVGLKFTGSGVALQPEAPELAELQNLTLSSGALVNQNPTLPAPQPYWSVWGSGSKGFYFNAAQLTFTSTSPDFTVGDLVIGYTDSNAVGI